MEKTTSEQLTADAVSLHINPYTLPPEQHGWRGLTIPGNHMRKWYTALHNDQVLVTVLLLIPGESGVRHSHESGELSVHFTGDLKPMITWNPPGVLHPPTAAGWGAAQEVATSLTGQEGSIESDNPEIAKLVTYVTQLRLEMSHLQQQLQERLRPEPTPRVLIDILFPPFKTTIDDPAYPEKKTVVGQWYD